MNRVTQYGLLGFVQVLQLVLWLYRVDGAIGWILCRKFGAPVPSVVPSADTRQVWTPALMMAHRAVMIKTHQKVLPLWNDRHLDVTSSSVTNL